MTEGLSLLLVLVAVYLSDCVIFLHRQAVALVRPWRTWRARISGWKLGNACGAFLGVQPLPPLGLVHETRPWPISIAEDGVCAFTSLSLQGADRAPQTGVTLLYGDIKNATASAHDLLIDGKVFATASSSDQATLLAALVSTVSSAPREGRMRLIGDAIDASLSVDAARDASVVVASRTRGLRFACISFWVYLYAICPLVTYLWGLGLLLIPLAVVGLMIHVPIVVWFCRIHGRMYPGERGSRIEYVFRMSLCPPMAIRAVDAVTRNSLAMFHPSAAVVALCPRGDAAALAGLVVRDLKYPAPIDLDPHGTRIELSFRGLVSERVSEMLSRNGILPEMTPNPDIVDTDIRTFCPRCLNVYTVESGTCHDCFDLKLETLPPQPSTGKDKK